MRRPFRRQAGGKAGMRVPFGHTKGLGRHQARKASKLDVFKLFSMRIQSSSQTCGLRISWVQGFRNQGAPEKKPFPRQAGGKGHRELSQTPPGNSRGSQKRSTRPSPELPRDGLYPSRSVLFPFPHGPFSSLSYTSVCVHKRSVRASRRSRRALFV